MSDKSMPTIPVRQNRRTTLRPLNQMNGDHLGELRAPKYGEWSKNVCGHNASTMALLKRDVRVWYEEHGNSVERIRRKQEKTYKEMLRLFREKKRVQRAAYRHQTDESKQAWSRAEKRRMEIYPRVASSLFGTDCSMRIRQSDDTASTVAEAIKGGDKSDISIHVDKAIVTEEVRGEGTGSLQAILVERTVDTHSPDVVRLIGHSGPLVNVTAVAVTVVPLPNVVPTSKPKEKTVRCVEVRRHRPNDPLTVERTSSTMTKECTEKGPLVITDTSGRVNITQNISVNSAMSTPVRGTRTAAVKATPPVHRGVIVTQTSSCKTTKRTPRRSSSPNSSTSTRTTLQPPRSVAKLPPVRQSDSKTTVDAETATSCVSTQRDKNAVSLAKLIKVRRKENELKKKRILNSESVPIYTKTCNGDVLATVLSFHRKKFNPPSQKESYFRFKMLRAQEEARRVQSDRMRAFFEKIRGDELTAEEQERQKKEPEGDGTTPKPNDIPVCNGLGVGLAKMAAAFNAYARARYDNGVTDDE